MVKIGEEVAYRVMKNREERLEDKLEKPSETQ